VYHHVDVSGSNIQAYHQNNNNNNHGYINSNSSNNGIGINSINSYKKVM
jgi:hypothetical protein